jgi:hypothetical protein
MSDEENGGQASTSGSQHSARGTPLVTDDGKFCFGPKRKIHAFLDVQRNAARRALVPAEELHASSVQHPEDLNM